MCRLKAQTFTNAILYRVEGLEECRVGSPLLIRQSTSLTSSLHLLFLKSTATNMRTSLTKSASRRSSNRSEKDLIMTTCKSNIDIRWLQSRTSWTVLDRELLDYISRGMGLKTMPLHLKPMEISISRSKTKVIC
jgi:hypothetical protein